jgi:cell division septal protein FtsQ
MIVLLVVANLLVGAASKSDRTKDREKNSLFGVKAITVVGDTRYLSEAIVQQSGLAVGQSVWTVNRVEAAEKVVAAFPYIKEATVTKTSFSTFEIRVTETDAIGVVYGFGQWLAVGENGRLLEAFAVESDRPPQQLYLKGAEALSNVVGEVVLDDRSLAIVNELLAAFQEYGFFGVGEIDLSNKSDLRLRWNNRITVKLGNDSNLTHEIGVVMSALPGIEKQYGEYAVGQLDVSSFSEGGTMAVFTPQDLLTTTTTTTTAPEEGTETEE